MFCLLKEREETRCTFSQLWVC